MTKKTAADSIKNTKLMLEALWGLWSTENIPNTYQEILSKYSFVASTKTKDTNSKSVSWLWKKQDDDSREVDIVYLYTSLDEDWVKASWRFDFGTDNSNSRKKSLDHLNRLGGFDHGSTKEKLMTTLAILYGNKIPNRSA
jgi:hypothetical protein